MKVKTQIAQLRANYGNISYEEIAEYAEIDRQQLRELESGEARAIEFMTLAKLCAFFQCTPNDLLMVELEEEENAPPSPEEKAKADEIIKRAYARAEAMPPRPAEEIWDSFETNIEKLAAKLSQSKSELETPPKRENADA
jgi:DNA-binding Xre family transcriptional regulator